MKTLTKMICGLVAAFALSSASAVTNCATKVSAIFSGGSTNPGGFSVVLANGMTFAVLSSDVNWKSLYSAANLAFTLQSPTSIEFLTSGVTCSGGSQRTDVTGIYVSQ